MSTERTKVNRKIKKAEKQLKEADTEESKKDAQKILDVLNIDLNYINVRTLELGKLSKYQ
jgi:hypothetical protein